MLAGTPRIVGGEGSGPSTLRFADAETPDGPVDGVNRGFQLAHNPQPQESLQLFVNGSLEVLGVDYTFTAPTVITFSLASTPTIGSTLQAWYRY